MAWDILDSLFTKKCYDAAHMARRFSETWEKETYRSYGRSVFKVFMAWPKNNYSDIYGPARKQFGGGGSFGNGGAMRVAPIALYCCSDQNEMNELVIKSTQLTHTHPLGIVGALLQCWSVRIALGKNPKLKALDASDFIDALIGRLERLADCYLKAKNYYTSDLLRMKDFLKEKDNTEIKKIIELFGNNGVAQRSVLTALFCFLRSANGPIDYLKAKNPFERTIQLACCLGGDADTIACMAGSIAGSYYGISGIPECLYKHCEGLDRGKQFAALLHKRASKVAKVSKKEKSQD